MNLQPIGRIIRLLKETGQDWMEDNCLRLSAALAYYSIFSIAPLLVIAISIAGLFFGAEAARGQVQAQLSQYVGAQTAQGVEAMVLSASKPSQGKLAAALGVFTLLLGASGVFGQLKDSLNTIWEVRQKPGGGIKAFFRERFLSLGMVLVIGFLLLISLMLTAALGVANKYLGEVLGVPAFVWAAISSVISLAVVAMLFALIFKILPDATVRWRNVWVGAGVTALFFELGKFGLGWYLGRESTASTYGAAGSVILLLLWAYYNSLILFFGAEFTQVYARDTGSSIQPTPNAEAVTAEMRAQEGLVPPGPLQGAEPSSAFAQRGEIRPPVIIRVPVVEPSPPPGPALTVVCAVAVGFGAGLLLRRRH